MNKNSLLSFYQKYKLILYPLGVILASFVLIFFIIMPQLNRLLDTNRNIGELNKKASFLEAKAEELSILDEEDLKGKLNLALLALPQETDFANIIGVVLNLTSQAQFSLISFQTDRIDPKAGTKSAAYGIKLSLIGPQDTLESLLNDIEKNARVMKVKSLEYTSSKTSEPIDVNLGIEVYYSPVPSTLEAVDAPLPKLTEKDDQIIASLARVAQQHTGEAAPPATSFGPRGKSNPFE